ncbi:hypothetical protein AVEN_216074-1 [Araneus ventricosus]|uniref:Uncharacterized protein n=1 Tax=Araneus ventricosus TaxID=182803 RepID=A0A4Y2P2Y7_ARAVE|nr:hypothetical protein AVEN_216074-1 [Araneus ventricosus]
MSLRIEALLPKIVTAISNSYSSQSDKWSLDSTSKDDGAANATGDPDTSRRSGWYMRGPSTQSDYLLPSYRPLCILIDRKFHLHEE